nr:Phosphatidate cytidylyltransferase [Klebsiella quasipneumoniae]
MTYWASESRRASRSRTANKGCFVLPGYQKAAGPPEAALRTRGCFVLPGYQKAAGPPGAGLRTRGLF